MRRARGVARRALRVRDHRRQKPERENESGTQKAFHISTRQRSIQRVLAVPPHSIGQLSSRRDASSYTLSLVLLLVILAKPRVRPEPRGSAKPHVLGAVLRLLRLRALVGQHRLPATLKATHTACWHCRLSSTLHFTITRLLHRRLLRRHRRRPRRLSVAAQCREGTARGKVAVRSVGSLRERTE